MQKNEFLLQREPVLIGLFYFGGQKLKDMKGRKIVFSPNAIQHIYRRAFDKGVIFYTLEDRIVFYTIIAVYARKYGITVYAASLMYTHIHLSISAESERVVEKFLQDSGSVFARVYNRKYGRCGELFDKPFGHSQKRGDKEKRTNIIYVFNNHVEKGLCRLASEERWSFLAYAESNNPFSQSQDLKTASNLMKRAINLVNRRVKNNRPLKYGDMDTLLSKMTDVEKNQFVDYVICIYRLVQFSATFRYFKDYRTLANAAASTTGGEWEIRETYSAHKDTAYVELVEWAAQKGLIKRLYMMTDEEKMDFYSEARYETSASESQLKKFFH